MKAFFRQILFSLLLALVFLIGSLTTLQPKPYIRLHFDSGGMIDDYLRFFQYLHESGINIQIDGDCVSACTLALTLPRSEVCITHSGRLGFHLARLIGQRGDPVITKELVDRYYPKLVQDWIEKNGPLQDAPIYLSGEEAIKLGILPPCKKEYF